MPDPNMSEYPNTLVNGVGEHAYIEGWKKLVGSVKKDQEVRRRAIIDMVPEPTNAYDKNAIQLFVDKTLVGYLSREDAAALGGSVKDLIRVAGHATAEGSIWAVLRSDGLKANVSMAIADDLFEEAEDAIEVSSPAVAVTQPIARKSNAAAVWGLVLSLMAFLASFSATTGIFMVLVPAAIIGLVKVLSSDKSDKLIGWIVLGISGLALFVFIIASIIQQVSK